MTEIVPHILAEEADGVLTLTIDRPEKKNALTREMYVALAERIETAGDDLSVGAIVLRGAGGVFTAGNDLRDFQARAATPEDTSPSGGMLLLQSVATCKAPLLAGVGGLAIGIGTTILLHCDFAYAAQSARFRTPFVDLGLSVEGASSLLLPQMIGPRAAAELLLAGDTLDAARAAALGLVNGVVADADLDATVQARAAGLAAKPRQALRAAKRMLQEARGSAVLDTIDREYVTFADCLRSPEAQAIFAGFFEKAS
ncbi:MAG: enoyl-CoA hydratase-related protein [Rhodospirillales bacterium]